MRAVRGRDSIAELAVRRRLWANGVRYRLNAKLPGRPDLAFPGRRIAVFIDGDLWHGNSWRVRGLPNLEAQFPTRTTWWVEKIRRNMERDRWVTEQLAADGWKVLRFWESDTLADPNGVARLIADRVRGNDDMQFHCLPTTVKERRRLGSVRTRAGRLNEAQPMSDGASKSSESISTGGPGRDDH
ncbi:MAG: very short patch repair endonuclease [Chloroflexi bacterium]|nr:very short patch repair endonuclease [Chloroflexota bacterium]